MALLGRHIYWIDRRLCLLYAQATTPAARRRIARAACLNVTAWLSWARSCKLFGLQWCDADLTKPGDGNRYELPLNVGCCLLELLPVTKSEQFQTADVVFAYTCLSGLSLGTWLLRLRSNLNTNVAWATDQSFIFCHESGASWTSKFYREEFLIPFLQERRSTGDAYLLSFCGSEPGTSLADVFWGLHSYLHGARTHVSLHNEECFSKAEPDNVTEQGRWERKRKLLPIHRQYHEAPMWERRQMPPLG
jgi:hypothetical protein